MGGPHGALDIWHSVPVLSHVTNIFRHEKENHHMDDRFVNLQYQVSHAVHMHYRRRLSSQGVAKLDLIKFFVTRTLSSAFYYRGQESYKKLKIRAK